MCSSILLYAVSASATDIFQLQSPAFGDNALMEKRFAGNATSNPNCTGENISPALVWNNPPAKTQSFALVVHDPEGAMGLGVTHLVAYNIPRPAPVLPKTICVTAKAIPAVKIPPAPCSGMVLALHRVAAHTTTPLP
jgi:phosphatidylethanolamine-binding protein (PEBP) family uncharacterized protein